MSDDDKEVLKLPELKVTNRDQQRLTQSGGVGINSADPDTPSYQVKDNSHPERLPEQQAPKSTHKN